MGLNFKFHNGWKFMLAMAAIVAVIFLMSLIGCSVEPMAQDELGEENLRKQAVQNVECVEYTLPAEADYQLIIDNFNGTGLFAGTATSSGRRVTASYGRSPSTGKGKYLWVNWLPWYTYEGFNYRSILFKFRYYNADGTLRFEGCVYPGYWAAPYKMKGKAPQEGDYLEFYEYPEARLVPISPIR